MLLRPNTHFALTWKFMWILCLLVEIATYVMNPRFEQYQKEHYSTQEVNLFSYLRAKAMPSLPHEWDECAFRSNFEPPWYCHELLVSLQVYFMKAMEFAVIETLAFVSVVFFLDVFVAFFTGVIDPGLGGRERAATLGGRESRSMRRGRRPSHRAMVLSVLFARTLNNGGCVLGSDCTGSRPRLKCIRLLKGPAAVVV